MLARRLHRFYGLTWCQWKRAVKQCITGQSQERVRPVFISTVHQQCAQMSSGAFGVNSHHTSQEVAEPVGTEQEVELTEKGIGRSYDEQDLKLLLKPDQPEDPRILRVAIIGLPNSGKSTLTNKLMGWRVSSVSKKVHTTQKNTTGIYTQGNTQLVFLDTPGILAPTSRKRHNLEKTLLIDPERSLHQADLVGVVVDVSNKWTRNELDPLILQVLHLHQHTPAVLILNKVDLLQSKATLLHMARMLSDGVMDGLPVKVTTKRSGKRQLDMDALFDAADADRGKIMAVHHQEENSLAENHPSENHPSSAPTDGDANSNIEQTKADQAEDGLLSESEAWTSYFQKMRLARRAVQDMKGWPHFKQIFMVSALSGDGVEEVKDYLLQLAKPGDWDYHSSLVTSQDPREVVYLCIREKLLEHLKQEIPYNMTMEVVLWEVDADGMFNLIVNVYAQNKRQVSFLIGPKGRTIQRIAQEAKQEMMNAFRCEMRLKLVAQVKQTSR